MSESDVEPVESIIERPGGSTPSGAGTMLRTAREALGLNIAMLAVSLKVPTNKLEALEAERFDLLPDTVFVRALASSMCRALGIDAAPVLAALPRSDMPKFKDNVAGLNTAFNDSPRGSGRVLLSHFGKPLGIVMVLFVVGIFAIVFLPSTAFTLLEPTPIVLSGEKSSVAPIALVSAEADIQPASNPSLQVSEVLQPLSARTNVDVPVDAASLAPSSTLNASAPTAVLAPDMVRGVNAGDVLRLRALGASWVEVLDAKGALQLRKTLQKDEIVSLSGALPLVVVLGRADLVLVTVRGQPFDTVSMAKDNVARFEVK